MGNQYEFLSQTVDEANAVVRLHFITAGPPSTAALHPLFRLVNPPAVRGMACPDVKKAVRKSDGFWKSGGGYKKDLKNSLDLKIGKVFQE